MKQSSISSFFLTLASVSFASPVPQETQAASSTTTLVQTVTVVPVPAAASPYPAGPTTNEFKYLNYDENSDSDKAKRKQVHDAFAGSWAAVLQKGVESLADTSDDTFDRWFPPNVKQGDNKPSTDARAYVRSVWTQMFSPDATTPTPKNLISTFVSDKNDYANLCKPKTDAYFSRASGKFHVCDKGLAYTTKAEDNSCDKLGNFVSTAMESTTGVLIHEFHHSDQVGDKVTNSVGHIRDITYGPSNCMRLRLGGDNQLAFVNADSYMWFALNAYYNNKCGKKYGDPIVTTEDFEDGTQQAEESNEYDATLASGIFAGV